MCSRYTSLLKHLLVDIASHFVPFVTNHIVIDYNWLEWFSDINDIVGRQQEEHYYSIVGVFIEDLFLNVQ